MGWRDYQKTEVEPVDTMTPDPFASLEKEYYDLLARYREIDQDPDVTYTEVDALVERLDVLYQSLHQKGRKVPIKLPEVQE